MSSFEKKWQIIQRELAAQASGAPSPKVVSTRTLFGIKSTGEEKMDAFAREIEQGYAARRRAAREQGRGAVVDTQRSNVMSDKNAACEQGGEVAAEAVASTLVSEPVPENKGEQMSRIEDLRYLINELYAERGEAEHAEGALRQAGSDEKRLFGVFRGLVNTRAPKPAAKELLAVQDRVLQSLIQEAGITQADALPQTAEGLSLWRGDITTLAVDAIVNAANSQLLGCWMPGHHCIDNAIHTFAGVQLRIKCAQIMEAQGVPEPTGKAKITPAYNLPARFVLHTVGPIAGGVPTEQDCTLLASCYTSCLDLAAANGLHSVAFCCISTGVFGFPQEAATRIAVSTVRSWLASHPQAKMHVTFNVFLESDERIYARLLGCA